MNMKEYVVSIEIREKRRIHYQKNRDQILESKRKYYRKNKSKMVARNAANYAKNKEYRKQQVKFRQKLIQSRVRDLKRITGCQEDGCNVTDPIMLDYDHIDRNLKKFGICAGINRGVAWSVILEEIAKCRVLCANHHRIHTASQIYAGFKDKRE